MQLESTKRNNQEYFAAWDKRIENTFLNMVEEIAIPFIVFLMLNIFAIAIVFQLKLY